MCHYTGKIRDIPDSWAAISTCDGGVSGVIFDTNEMYYIEKCSNLQDLNQCLHFVYKHSDLAEHNKTCGYGGDAYEPIHVEDHARVSRVSRNFIPGGTQIDFQHFQHKRSADPQIRGPYNAGKQSRYVELVLVVDNREYKEYGENKQRVEQRCKEIANIINGVCFLWRSVFCSLINLSRLFQLYAPLNIFIALVGVVIWTEYDEIDFSSKGDTTLTNFLHYRREKLIKEHPNDNAQLLT